MKQIRNWTTEDYHAEEEALEVLGPLGQAEVLRDLLEQKAKALAAAHDAADYLVTLAQKAPEGITVTGYVSSLDARDLIDTRDWRLACRQRHEAQQKREDEADAKWLASRRTGEAACDEGPDEDAA